jgi:hypothetical protein
MLEIQGAISLFMKKVIELGNVLDFSGRKYEPAKLKKMLKTSKQKNVQQGSRMC